MLLKFLCKKKTKTKNKSASWGGKQDIFFMLMCFTRNFGVLETQVQSFQHSLSVRKQILPG